MTDIIAGYIAIGAIVGPLWFKPRTVKSLGLCVLFWPLGVMGFCFWLFWLLLTHGHR